jgi:hypothetical protein
MPQNQPLQDSYCNRAPESVTRHYQDQIRRQGFIDLDVTGGSLFYDVDETPLVGPTEELDDLPPDVRAEFQLD